MKKKVTFLFAILALIVIVGSATPTSLDARAHLGYAAGKYLGGNDAQVNFLTGVGGGAGAYAGAKAGAKIGVFLGGLGGAAIGGGIGAL